MAKADAALSFSREAITTVSAALGRQRALDACLFVITGGETRPRVDAGHPHKEQIGVDPRHSRQRLGADGDNRMFEYSAAEQDHLDSRVVHQRHGDARAVGDHRAAEVGG